MASRRFKIRMDSMNNILFKEEMKVLVTSKDIKVTLNVVTGLGGEYVLPYQMKNNFAYSVAELAKAQGMSVRDYMIEQSFKTYSPFYDIVNKQGEGGKMIVCFKITADRQTGEITNIQARYYALGDVISTKEMLGFEATSGATPEVNRYVRVSVFGQFKPIINAHIQACLGRNV